LSVVDELQSSLIPNEFLTIEGIEELQGAVDALNNLDEATADVLEYNDQVETVVHEDGTVTVDFSDGIGNHIDSAVNDIVIEALNDVVDAINNVKIEILPGAADLPGVGIIIDGLNDLVNGVLGSLTDVAGDVKIGRAHV